MGILLYKGHFRETVGGYLDSWICNLRTGRGGKGERKKKKRHLQIPHLALIPRLQFLQTIQDSDDISYSSVTSLYKFPAEVKSESNFPAVSQSMVFAGPTAVSSQESD